MPVDEGSVAWIAVRVREMTLEARVRTPDELLADSRDLIRQRLAGDQSAELLARSLAACWEALARTLGSPVPGVAVNTAAAMIAGVVGEVDARDEAMAASAMCAYWYALAGGGVHVAAADQQEAEGYQRFLARAFTLLGFDVGLLLSSMPAAERRVRYAAPVTVGAYTQLASDHLRDSRQDLTTSVAQRGLAAAVVVDACEILVDHALDITYLAERGVGPRSSGAERIAAGLKRDENYRVDHEKGTVWFTTTGADEIRRAVRYTGGAMASVTLGHEIEAALLSREGLLDPPDSDVVADITTQGYFRGYGSMAAVSHQRRTCAEALARVFEAEPSSSDLAFERLVDEQRTEVYGDRTRIRDGFDAGPALRSLVSDVVHHWSRGGVDEIMRGLHDVRAERVRTLLATAHDSTGSLDDFAAATQRLLEQEISDRRDGQGHFDDLLRRIHLTVIDEQWSQHLARVRFIQRHGTALDGAPADPAGQREQIQALYTASRQRMREHAVGYALNIEG